MAINPLLLNVKPISEITTVNNPIKGHLLFYDGSDELKKVDIVEFQSLIGGIAKPLAITDASPTVSGWYKPTKSGTYANAGGLVAQAGYDTLFYFDGTTWSLVSTEILIDVENITPSQTTFAKEVILYGKNRFNKNAVTTDFYVNAFTGALNANSNYVASDWIFVGDLQGQNITFSPLLIHVAFYAKKNETSFISGREYGGNTIQVPQGANWLRCSVFKTSIIDSYQIEVGETTTVYKNYQEPKKEIIIPFLKIEVADGSINPEKTDFFESENLANPVKKVIGNSVDEVTGNFYTDASYDLFKMIPINGDSDYYFSHIVRYAFYDSSKTFISGSVYTDGAQQMVSSPSSAKYISFSVYSEAEIMMSTGGYKDYLPFKKVLKGQYIPEKKITIDDVYFVKEDYTRNNLFLLGAGNDSATGTENFGEGRESLINLTTGISNYASGFRALQNLKDGNGNHAAGIDCMKEAVSTIDCTFFGWEAGRDQVSGVGDTGTGRRTLAKAKIAGNNTGYGDSNLYRVQPNPQTGDGMGNVSSGYVCMEYGFKSKNSVASGIGAARYVNLIDSVVIGNEAYYGVSMTLADRESDNIDVSTKGERVYVIGSKALQYAGSLQDVVGMGSYVLLNAKNNRHIAFGSSAGAGIENATDTINIGYSTGTTGDFSNTINIGSQLNSDKENQVKIGNSTHDEFVICGVTFTKAQIQALKDLVS